MKRVDAILVGDLHLRDSVPLCRDPKEWLEAMIMKLKFICDLKDKYHCGVVQAGDVFHSWDASPELISFAIEHLPNDMVCIPGQHDIPKHNLKLFHKSALFTLWMAGKVVLTGDKENYLPEKVQTLDATSCPFHTFVKLFPFGAVLKPNAGIPYDLAVIHTMVYGNDKHQDWEERAGSSAGKIARSLSGFGTILSGDNHKSLEYEHKGCCLLNPGSLFRMTSDQKSHRPCVYLWNDKGEHEKVYVPIKADAVSDDHVVTEKEKEERISTFVERMRDDIEAGLDFEINMEEYIKKNNMEAPIEEKIWEMMEGAK